MKMAIIIGCEHSGKRSATRWFYWNWSRIKEDGERKCFCDAVLKYKIL